MVRRNKVDITVTKAVNSEQDQGLRILERRARGSDMVSLPELFPGGKSISADRFGRVFSTKTSAVAVAFQLELLNLLLFLTVKGRWSPLFRLSNSEEEMFCLATA